MDANETIVQNVEEGGTGSDERQEQSTPPETPPAGAAKEGEGEAGKGEETPPAAETEGGEKPTGEVDADQQRILDAGKRVQELLDRHGFFDLDELQEALEGGLELKDLIGNEDAKQLVEDATTLRNYRKIWAEQQGKSGKTPTTPDLSDEDLSPEEKLQLQQQEIENLRQQLTEREEAEATLKETQKAIESYKQEVGLVLDHLKVPDEHKEFAELLMGVNNPLDDVDIRDRRAVRRGAMAVGRRFQEFIKAVQQQAIDNYAKGRGEVRPSVKEEGSPGSSSLTGKPKIPENATLEETFAILNEQLLEELSKSAGLE